MRFGVIEYNGEAELLERSGSVSRRGVVPVPDALGVRAVPSAYEIIYLVAVPAHTVVFDIELPGVLSGHLLENALKFELEQLIPLPLEQVSWCYRRMSRDGRKFRVCATRLDELRPIFDRVAAAGLCCDCFLPAQLLLHSAGDAGTDKISPSELLREYLPCDPNGKNLHLPVDLVPRALRPVRNRGWRLIYKVLVSAAALVLLMLLGLRFQQFSAESRMLSGERAELERKLRETQAFSEQLTKFENFSQRIADAKIGTASVLPILADLNQRLPRYMYLSSYQQSAEQIELVIVSTHDDPNLPRILLGSKLYQSDLRKTVQPDSRETTFNVTLRSLLP